MKIVAIDFETANDAPCSACSLGIASMDEEIGVVEEDKELLFKLHPRYSFFTNTWIHGIDNSMVENEKEFSYYYEDLKKKLEGNVIVAHCAGFDVNVLNKECELYGLDRIHFQYIDTVEVSRKVYPELYNHKLNTMAEYLHINLDHHHASSDALACLLILLKAMEAYQCFELNDFIKKLRIKVKENL